MKVGRLIAALSPPVIALAVILSFGTGRVDHESMRPTLESGDTVVFDRLLPAQRGDVVVVADPSDWSTTSDANLVKRVIAVGGDRVVCCEVGTLRLLVNGEPVDEDYVFDAERPGGSIPFDLTVPDSSLWLVGDNRAASHDSRTELSSEGGGAVPRSAVLGVVRFVVPG